MSASLLVTLFAGAFLDATLGFCFFVFGEAFFIMAGGLAYSENAWIAIITVFSGAYAADQTGYMIGRTLRPVFHRFVLAKCSRRAVFRKARALLDRHGVKAVALSRLMGPVAWFMPPVCGGAGLAWTRFALGSACGVLLGVGGFVILGYAGAWGAAQADMDVGAFINRYKWVLLVIGQSVFVIAAILSHFVGNALFRRA